MEDKYLKIKVIPGASKTERKEIMADGTWKITVSAPPEKNKANIELIRYLSTELKIPKNRVKILSGHSSRTKLLKLEYGKETDQNKF